MLTAGRRFVYGFSIGGQLAFIRSMAHILFPYILRHFVCACKQRHANIVRGLFGKRLLNVYECGALTSGAAMLVI